MNPDSGHDIIDRIAQLIPDIGERWAQYRHWFTEIDVKRSATLLHEGEVARRLYFVKSGCLRASMTHRGKEITFQFFFEDDVVASIESFRSRKPSGMSIKAVERSTLIVLGKPGLEQLARDFPGLKDIMLETAFRRFEHYTKLFVSSIRDTPRQRYLAILRDDPRIVQRVPQHFIASYLGITPVSLSRIRRTL
jgi:CRP-like cAMP-binding protein